MGAEVEWPFDQAGEYRDQLIEYKDFTRTTIRESRLNDVRLIGVEMIDAEIDGYIENLVVNGVDVTKLVEDELDRRYPVRVTLRSDRARAAAARLVRARRDVGRDDRSGSEPHRSPAPAAGRDEWSVTETIRHLVFVVDSWFSRGVLDEPLPYHPAGLSPSFMTGIEEMGIDTAATPSFEEAVAIWTDRTRKVSTYLASATSADLAGTCQPNDGPLLAAGHGRHPRRSDASASCSTRRGPTTNSRSATSQSSPPGASGHR